MADADGTQDAIIVDHLRRAFGAVLAIYRFGSSATGTATAASDVDVAVLAPARLAPERRFEVQETLASALGTDVDLVDLSSASTVMAMQVIAGGRLLFDGDSQARGHFEDRTFSGDGRLNDRGRRLSAERGPRCLGAPRVPCRRRPLPKRYSQPLSRAIRAASTRFDALSLSIASER